MNNDTIFKAFEVKLIFHESRQKIREMQKCVLCILVRVCISSSIFMAHSPRPPCWPRLVQHNEQISS